MATAAENNALVDGAATIYFSTEDRLAQLAQTKADIEGSLYTKLYTFDVLITELRDGADLTNIVYQDTLNEIDTITQQRTGTYYTDGRSNYDVLYQFFRTDNPGATSIVNETQDKKLELDGSDNVVISNYP